MALFLFDVDQTLVNSGGAGGKAMNLAFRDIFGIENGFQGVEFSGRTDAAIFRDALRMHSLPKGDPQALLRQFEETYIAHLAHTLRETTGRVMPGVRRLVAALAGTSGARVGLATGNLRRGAMLKLGYYGVSAHLREGGFGEDSEDRGRMVALAVRRLGGGSGAGVFVIGDTPLDVDAAHVNGFTAVGVATGQNTVDNLRAAGADLVFQDFGDVDDSLKRLLAAAKAASA